MKERNSHVGGLFKKAVADGQNRNYTAAVKKFKKILEVSDNFTEAHLYLGRAYHELGMFEDAIVSFRFFITKAPKSSAGYFYLGRTYIASELFQRAVSCFSESIRLKPDFAPSLAYMGYALMRTGSLKLSVSYLRQAVENDSEDTKIYTMYINSIFAYSLKEFKKENYSDSLNGLLFLEEAGFSSITTSLYIGIIFKEMHRWSDSIYYINQAMQLIPEDILIKNILAELYIRDSRMDEAFALLNTYMNEEQIRAFIKSIDNSEISLAISFWKKDDLRAAHYFAMASLKKARSPEMHLLAGECLKSFGRLDDAYNHYSRALSFDSRAIEPLYGQAVILWLKNDYRSMLDIIAKIEKLNPADDFAVYYRILCSSELELPYEKWSELLDELKIDDDPWLLTAKGFGLLSVKNYSGASKFFRKSIKENDKYRKSWTGLIDSQKQSKSTGPVLSTLKRYLNSFPDDFSQRNYYSRLLMDAEKYSEAADQLRILMSAEKPESGILQTYGFCCRKSQRWGDAAVVYRQLLAGDPYNENYLKTLLFCMRKDGKDKETIPLLREAVHAFKKPSVDLMLVYGTSLYRNDMDEEALNIFQKCIYNGINDWRVYRNMGIIYRNKGLSEWSEMYFKKSEKLKKN